MNDKIKELAMQAQQYAEWTTPQGLEWFDAFKEKFAELIVKECIDCLKPLSQNHSMVGAAQDTIKEHFGVEE